MKTKIAKLLLDSGSVIINTKDPFTLTSGKKSPIYVNCRKLISYPKYRKIIIKNMQSIISAFDFDIIAGGETAGIPYAAFLSDAMNKPMIYVRKKPKGFGTNSQIEGDFKPNQKVLLVEDLATDGSSKSIFIKALRDNNLICNHCIVIFYYDIFNIDLDIELHHLSTWNDILSELNISSDDMKQVKMFLNNPDEWRQHVGK